MKASIVIRTKNEEALLRQTLNSIRKQSHKNYEIIIVGSGSTDKTTEIAKEFDVQIYEIPPEKFTFGYSLNFGISKTCGEYIVVISAHCVPCDNQWLANLISPLQNKNVAGVYGRQVAWQDAHFFEKLAYEKCYPTFNIKNSKSFSNANSAIKKSAWEVVKFNEEVGGCEDLIWLKAMNSRDQIIEYASSASVWHSHNESYTEVKKRVAREHEALISLMPEAKYQYKLIREIAASFLYLIKAIVTGNHLKKTIKGFIAFELGRYSALIFERSNSHE